MQENAASLFASFGCYTTTSQRHSLHLIDLRKGKSATTQLQSDEVYAIKPMSVIAATPIYVNIGIGLDEEIVLT